ncbi:unnamed protein product [Dibothriocephalus latus]|uniref:DUF4806 domain-containing protein n=1 Tax=Dibothriocephalus latus TaxID=60516 RepID=A0A3P7LXU5_DIBLA|nr:unnamed protein product [Dibothriocephalus latus]
MDRRFNLLSERLDAAAGTAISDPTSTTNTGPMYQHMRTVGEVDEFTTALLDPSLRQQVITHLTAFGGDTVSTFADRIFGGLFADEITYQMTFYRRHQVKRGFFDSSLFKIVLVLETLQCTTNTLPLLKPGDNCDLWHSLAKINLPSVAAKDRFHYICCHLSTEALTKAFSFGGKFDADVNSLLSSLRFRLVCSFLGRACVTIWGVFVLTLRSIAGLPLFCVGRNSCRTLSRWNSRRPPAA